MQDHGFFYYKEDKGEPDQKGISEVAKDAEEVILTKDEIIKIAIIKKDFSTRNKWSKQDYSDFYFRDITFLLGVIEKLIEKSSENPSETQAQSSVSTIV